jgi:aminoglycoside 3-N-acetyltransferase I
LHQPAGAGLSGGFTVSRLTGEDIDAARRVNALFEEVFEDPASYASAPPSGAYLAGLLDSGTVIALLAESDGQAVGGLVAYVLPKLEQERSEIYIYDLAVAEDRRREGIATALISKVKGIAAEIGAWVIYVQADQGDDPAIALYEGLGRREDVLHFDIAPRATR